MQRIRGDYAKNTWGLCKEYEGTMQGIRGNYARIVTYYGNYARYTNNYARNNGELCKKYKGTMQGIRRNYAWNMREQCK